jgi:hypothetical protein
MAAAAACTAITVAVSAASLSDPAAVYARPAHRSIASKSAWKSPLSASLDHGHGRFRACAKP